MCDSDIWIAQCVIIVCWILLCFRFFFLLSLISFCPTKLCIILYCFYRALSLSLFQMHEGRCEQHTHSHAPHFALIFMLIFTRWCLYQKVWVEWWGVFLLLLAAHSSILFCQYKRNKCTTDVWKKFLDHTIPCHTIHTGTNDSHWSIYKCSGEPQLYSKWWWRKKKKHFFLHSYIISVKNYHWKIKWTTFGYVFKSLNFVFGWDNVGFGLWYQTNDLIEFWFGST